MKTACLALSRAADNMARFYDAHQREAPLYAVGDKVWLNGKNITMTFPMKKLDHKWLGQYLVDKLISQKCILTQVTGFIWPNTPHIIGHPITTLQCGHHC